MIVHHKLQWKTIIDRLNSESEYEKYRDEGTNIFKLESPSDTEYYFCHSKVCKISFLRQEYDEYYGYK